MFGENRKWLNYTKSFYSEIEKAKKEVSLMDTTDIEKAKLLKKKLVVISKEYPDFIRDIKRVKTTIYLEMWEYPYSTIPFCTNRTYTREINIVNGKALWDGEFETEEEYEEYLKGLRP